MDGVRAAIDEAGGVLRRRDLLQLGFSDRRIASALRSGAIVRARQGWFANPDLTPIVMDALRVGGYLSGAAALETYGVWMPERPSRSLQVPRNASRNGKRLQNVRTSVHWGAEAHPDPSSPRPVWRAQPAEAFAQVLRTCSRDAAVIIADSMINIGLESREVLRGIFLRSGERVAGWFGLVDERADAGGETLARLRLGDAGILAVPQFVIPGGGPFDLRVSARGLLEVDGREHHDSSEAFFRDREKDLRAAVWEFEVLRLTYAQLRDQWPTCLAVFRRWCDEHGPADV